MEEKQSWDWTTDLKEIPLNDWGTRFNWVEEPCISCDGEHIASIVNVDDMTFAIWENGEVWEEEYEKAWSLRALPSGGFAACVCRDDQWTLAVNNGNWSHWFDFIWDLQARPDGISLAFQREGKYGMAVNDTPWDRGYENMNGMVLGNQGASAAVVQVKSMAAADVEAFKQGLFSVALNGQAFEERFYNIWDISLDENSQNLAWGVRLDRETYTIVVNDAPWENRFQSVWKPEFFDQAGTVVAPVRQGGKWKLFKNDRQFWKREYEQVWQVKVSPVNYAIAAIVAPEYGQWTVAQDDCPWPRVWDTMVRELHYSLDGSCLVAVVKDKGSWTLAVKGRDLGFSEWNLGAHNIFTPCISWDGSLVAVVFEKQGRYFLAVNNAIITGPHTLMADPVISPDGRKVLVKTMDGQVYKRRVIPLGEKG